MIELNFEQYQEELVKLRRHFHQYPELSMEEHETAGYVEAYLQAQGIETTRIGELGITATIPGNDPHGKLVILRAEMDALPIKELTELPWASVRKGVMHACGHDAILACGLVLAKICHSNRHLLRNSVKFLFQPAEENGEGTKLMLDAGVMENPKADAYLMFHFANDMPYGMEVQYGSCSAAIGEIQIKVKGKGAHWGNPSLGKDAIEVGAHIVTALKEFNTTYHSDLPFVTGIGHFEGGTAKNIIAPEVHLEGTLRTCRMEDYHQLRQLILEKLAEIATERKVQIQVDITEDPVKPMVNDTRLVDLALACGKPIWGDACREVKHHFLSGDSASAYFEHAPGLFTVFTAKKESGKSYPIHNGKFDIDEREFHKVVETLFRLIEAC